MAHCAKCGALLVPGAQFCSKCGTPVTVAPVQVAPPVTPVPVTPAPLPSATATAPKRNTWWIVPLVIVGLVVVAWLLLAGLPFGGSEEKKIATTATTETIAEGTVANPRPVDTGTVVDVGSDSDQPLETTTTPPPMATQTTATVAVPQPSTAPPPNPVVIEDRPPVAQPRPTPVPAPAPREEITDGEALSVLRNYLASNNPYDDVSGDCLQTRSMGYKNVGYTFSVWSSCVEGGGSRMLGRWRVDAKTREIFRQADDGRYLRP